MDPKLLFQIANSNAHLHNSLIYSIQELLKIITLLAKKVNKLNHDYSIYILFKNQIFFYF